MSFVVNPLLIYGIDVVSDAYNPTIPRSVIQTIHAGQIITCVKYLMIAIVVKMNSYKYHSLWNRRTILYCKNVLTMTTTVPHTL